MSVCSVWVIQIRTSDLRSLRQGLKLTFWITNPLVVINFTNQIIKLIFQESVLELTIY